MRASKPAQVNTRGPRPLAPQSVVDLVCGPHADPRLGPAARSGTFVEYDLVETPPMFANPSPGDRLVRVEPGHERECGVMIGVMTHVVDGHPEGISRVWIGGDPSRSMGAVAEAECRRIIAAIDLAERLDVPVEWVAISAGARIAWDSGTENMDWCAAVVARLITFTQRGGQVVVVVSGINVGAQSYWNAEATMLGHHKGMLIMLPDQAMVLTGKRALALSGGGTHATDAHIGGYDEVMGPNGQAHHKAADDDRRLPDGVLAPLAVQPPTRRAVPPWSPPATRWTATSPRTATPSPSRSRPSARCSTRPPTRAASRPSRCAR